MPVRRNTLLADPKIGSGISALAAAIGPHPDEQMRGALFAQQSQLANQQTQNAATQNQLAQRKLQAAQLVDQAFARGDLVENPDGSVSMPKGAHTATLLIRAVLTADPGADINPLLTAINRGPDANRKQADALQLQREKPLTETEAKGQAYQRLPQVTQGALLSPSVETSAGATRSFAPGDPTAPGYVAPNSDEVRPAIPVGPPVHDFNRQNADIAPAGQETMPVSNLAQAVAPSSTQLAVPGAAGANGRPDTGAIRQAHASNLSSIQQIQNAIESLQGNQGAVGLQNYLPDALVQRAVSDPQARADTLAQIGTVSSVRRHALFGGQLTGGESGYSAEFIPQKTDKPQVALAKLQRLKAAVMQDDSSLTSVMKQDVPPNAGNIVNSAAAAAPTPYQPPALPTDPDPQGQPSAPVMPEPSQMAKMVVPQSPDMALPPQRPIPSPSPRQPPVASAPSGSALSAAVAPQDPGMALPPPRPAPTPATPPIASAPAAGIPITHDIALKFYQQAGGDKQKAQQMALDQGYSF